MTQPYQFGFVFSTCPVAAAPEVRPRASRPQSHDQAEDLEDAAPNQSDGQAAGGAW
jgi:hypothetical protein